MKPEQLLDHFDRISDALDAIPRLRQFILDLAVRGKLVEQDPRDEPASELLKRIQAEKERLVSAGEIRKQETTPPIDEEELPFDIPPGWCWVRLIGVLNKLTDGTHHSPPNLVDGAFKYITAKNIKPEGVLLTNVSYVTAKIHHEIYSRCNPEKGDLLYIKDGATTGVVTINNLDEPFSMLSSVALLKLSTGVYNRLLVEFLRSPFFYMQMRGFMKGAAITRVTLKRMAPALIPLPPLAEQHRIVAKVDELMALCDRLEAAQAERESRRDRLVASSLNRLNNGTDADTFHDHARFYFNHLPRLTTKPEHIQQLRQTILNLAVRGKLVEQDSRDEPASELLRRIQNENARLGMSGDIGTETVEPLDRIEIPFKLPAGWLWTTLGEICSKTGSGSTPRGGRSAYQDHGIPFLRSQNIYNDGLRLHDVAYIDQETHRKMESTVVNAADLLLNITGGSMGRCCRVPDDFDEANVSQHVAIIRVVIRGMQDFLHRLILSPYFQSFIFDEQTGAGRGGLPKNKMDRIPVALPPLAEQHRIVAKGDELMALCDKLEAQLTTTHTDSRRLLEAVLHDVLAQAV